MDVGNGLQGPEFFKLVNCKRGGHTAMEYKSSSNIRIALHTTCRRHLTNSGEVTW